MAAEKELLKAISLMKQGKEEGFNLLYSYTYNYVYGRAKYIMKNEQDALDLTQETFIQAYRGISSLKDPENIYAWLGSITYRQGMRIYRGKKELLLDEGAESMFEDVISEDKEGRPEEAADAKATSDIIKGMIDELPELQRAAVMAFYYDNMKIDEIARVFECSSNTIKSRLHYAKQYLKDKVTEHERINRYKLCSLSPAVLLLAFKALLSGEKYAMQTSTAQSIFNVSCSTLGLVPTAIKSSVAATAAVTGGAAASGAGTAVATVVGTATKVGLSLGAKIAMGIAAVGVAGAVSVGAITLSNNTNDSNASAPQLQTTEESRYPDMKTEGAASSEESRLPEEESPLPEEESEAEKLAAALTEKYGLNEEQSAMLLNELEWAYETYANDKDTLEMAIEEITYETEKLANADSEDTQPEINWDMANLPTDRAWIDDLYNKLISDDYEAVLEILKDDSIAEKAAPYLYKDYVYDAYGYKLVTSDGKFVGLQLPIDMSSNFGRYAWYSENEDTDYGFMHTGHGDKEVHYEYSFMENKWYYSWFDGQILHHHDGETYELGKDEVLTVWEM